MITTSNLYTIVKTSYFPSSLRIQKIMLHYSSILTVLTFINLFEEL